MKMNIEDTKSLFDYTDKEFAEIVPRLMKGAGRRYRDIVEVIAAVAQINKTREAGRVKEIELKTKNLDPKKDWKLSMQNQEFISLYRLGLNESDFLLDELEKAKKLKGEEKNSHLRMADETYQYCKQEKIKIPKPIEDYFLQYRRVSSAEERKKLYEEIREWYLENKPDYSPKRHGELLRWIILILILVVSSILIIRFPIFQLLLVAGFAFLLICRKWGFAGIVFALFLILRFLSRF